MFEDFEGTEEEGYEEGTAEPALVVDDEQASLTLPAIPSAGISATRLIARGANAPQRLAAAAERVLASPAVRAVAPPQVRVALVAGVKVGRVAAKYGPRAAKAAIKYGPRALKFFKRLF